MTANDGTEAAPMRAASGEVIRETIVERTCAAICEVVLVAMVVMINVEVIIRAFGFTLDFVDEVGGYLLAALTFLSLPVALVGDAFHRVEFVQARLSLINRRRITLGFTILALAFAAILEWQFARLVGRSYQSGVAAPTILGAPMWIPQSTMLIGTTCLIFSLIRLLLRDFRSISALNR